MITIDAERLADAVAKSQGERTGARLRFAEWDGGDAYTCLEGLSGVVSFGQPVWAEVVMAEPKSLTPTAVASLPLARDTSLVLVVGSPGQAVASCGQPSTECCVSMLEAEGVRRIVDAYVRREDAFERVKVNVVPYRAALYERRRGILETPVLEGKKVCVLGLGTGGAHVAVELAKSGVGSFMLVDDDRLEVGNVVRHSCGLADVGRYKTKAVADLLRGKNPYANVSTHEIRADWDIRDQVESLIRHSDLVICATDSRESKLLVNRLSVIAGVTAIYGGAFRRAYGGQVFVVRPGATPCYQCFVQNLPEMAANQEISGPEEAEGIAYSDRPVPVEPGLSIDVAPICTMVAKIAVVELLRGIPTTLSTLYDDLKFPWYMWVNRREPDTDFAVLATLDSPDRMSVLRWYGVNLERDSNCPVCGESSGANGAIPENPSSPPLEAL